MDDPLLVRFFELCFGFATVANGFHGEDGPRRAFHDNGSEKYF